MSGCGAVNETCGSTTHLCIKADATKTATFYYREPDGTTPIDITGLEARIRFAAVGGDTNLLTLTSDPAAGLTITPLLGQIDMKITPAQTGALNLDVKLEWDLELYDPGDATVVTALVSGTADVTGPVP